MQPGHFPDTEFELMEDWTPITLITLIMRDAFIWSFPSTKGYGLGLAYIRPWHIQGQAGWASWSPKIMRSPWVPRGLWKCQPTREVPCCGNNLLLFLWMSLYTFISCTKCKLISYSCGTVVRRRQGTRPLVSPPHSEKHVFLTDLMFEFSCQPRNKGLLYEITCLQDCVGFNDPSYGWEQQSTFHSAKYWNFD